MKKIIQIFLFSLLVLSNQAFSQVYYPVVARVTQAPPYPVYLSDFANPAQTNLSIQIQQNDATITSRPVRLKILIEGQGFMIESTDQVQGEPALMLNYGQVYNLSSAEVANYFKQYNLKINPAQYSKPFNEGSMRFGVQVIDFATNRPLSGVQWGAPVWITQNEPPVWIMPENNTEISPSNAQNIVFQWAPRHSNVADVEYELTIKELFYNTLAMGNVQNVFLAQPDFYTARTTSTTFVYNAAMPPLIEGRTYGYRVRAISKRGMEEVGVFKNNGYSEVQSFAYGEPMIPIKPPVITSLNRDEITNITQLDWKAEKNHTVFSVAFREKGLKQEWTEQKVNAVPNSIYYSNTFSNFDPSKSYEIRIGAEDRYKQFAYSESVFLDSIAIEKAIEVELGGKINWTFAQGEQEYSENSAMGTASGKPGRQQTVINHSGLKDSKTFRLEKALVTLISSADDDITVLNLTDKKYDIIQKTESDADGSFTINTTNLKLLRGLQNLYILVDYPNSPFENHVEKLGLLNNLKLKNTLPEIVLKANSARYSPRVLNPEFDSFEFENIGLYRLASLIESHSYLANEGSQPDVKTLYSYNNQLYQKIADLSSSTTSTALLGNQYFNDQYILLVKQKGLKEVVIPVESFNTGIKNTINHITDYYNYLQPLRRIHGFVKKGAQVVSGAYVQGFGKSTQTNPSGYYSLDIPVNKLSGFVEKIKAIDPLAATNFVSENTYIGDGDIELNFSLADKGFYLEGQVINIFGKPVSGALVQFNNNFVKTNGNGWFEISGFSHQLPDRLTIKLDGYNDLTVPVSQFKKNEFASGGENQDFVAAVNSDGIEDKNEFYNQKYSGLGIECSTIYTTDPLVINRDFAYRIVVAEENRQGALGMVNLSDSSAFISTNLLINDISKTIPKGSVYNDGKILKGTGGYIGVSSDPAVRIQYANESGKFSYVEEDLLLTIPESSLPNDTTTFLVQLRHGVNFKGIVLDSTIYIEGLHVPGSVPKAGEKLNAVADATVSVIDVGSVKTNSEGRFEMVLPVGREIAFELTKPGFTKTTTFMPARESDDYKNTAKDFYMMQIDTNTIPKILTVMGFEAQIDRIVVNSSDVIIGADLEDVLKKGNRTYKISGKLKIDTNSPNRFKADNPTLSFVDWLVMVDENNAVLLNVTESFIETQISTKLFGYAPVTFKGNPGGESRIRIRHIKGSSGNGKIGASTMSFSKSNMAGLNFGDLELLDPEEEEEFSFGGFNDEVSEEKKNDPAYQAQLKLAEEKAKEEAEKARKAKEEAEKEAKAKGIEPPKPATEIPETDKFILAFASLPLSDLNDAKEFLLGFGKSKVKDSTILAMGINEPGFTFYKAEFAATNIPGIYSLMNMFIKRETAILNKDGISMEGYFALPDIWKFKNMGPLTISTLKINKNFDLEEITISKSPKSKKGEITKLAVGSKWIIYVNELQMYNNFSGFGLGGTINMDKENYLKINNFGLTVSGGKVYPNLSLSTPETGLKFKSIKFTTLAGKAISFRGNAEEESYELDASFKMEFVSSGSSAVKNIASKVFPVQIDRLLWSTTGKFLVAINAGKMVELGPVKVKISKVFYSKGAAVTEGEINNYLKLTQEEADKLNSTTMFNDANTKFVNGKKTGVFSEEERARRDAVSSDELFVSSLADEVAEEDPAARWAFAFGGGLEVTNTGTKSFNFDSQLSFYIGDFGDGIKFHINEIGIKMDATAFKVAGRVRIETAGERVGFEGDVEVETVKRKFAAAFKFYQLYDAGSGKKKGIELGAALKVSTMIPMGPVTWTSIGGGFDLNTDSQKYKFFFTGSAINTGVPDKLSEYRNINLSIEFDGKECSGLPVIKGGASVYVNGAFLCEGSLELDFCNTRVVGKISCQKEFIKGVNMSVAAIIVASKDGFFAGANAQAKLFGNNANALIAFGGQFNTNATFAPELSTYRSKLPAYIKQADNRTFSGIYLEMYQVRTLSFKKNISISGLDLVSANLQSVTNGTMSIGVNFINGNFMSDNSVTSKNSASLSVLGIGLYGSLDLNLKLKGGYTNAEGWNILGSASANIQIHNGFGSGMSCNTFDWRVYEGVTIKYPCGWCCFSWTRPWGKPKTCSTRISVPVMWEGFKVKACVSGSLTISYAEKGANSGWKFKI